MSLIHWWPLNGDLQDKIQGKVLSTSTWTSSTEGKIGSCYNMNIGGIATCSNIYLPSTFTMTCWVKNNDLAYPQSPCAMKLSNGSPYKTTAADKGWEFCHGGTLSFTTNDGVAPKAKFLDYNPGSLIGAWYHLALVSDFINKVAYIYINGSLVKSATITSGDWGGTYTFTVGQLYGWKIDGLMNDLRLYDHALSQAEVKELSKALVIHYTFDDILAESTTNIDPCKDSLVTHNFPNTSFGAITRTYGNFYGFDCVEMHLNTTYSSSVWLYMNSNPISQGAKVGDTVTRSCWMYIPSGQTKPPHFTESIEGNSSGKTFVQYDFNKCDTWQKISMTGTVADTGTNNYLHYFMAGSGTVNFKWYMRDFQMEIKDHATPYTSSSRVSMIQNETGYAAPKAVTAFQLSTVTNSGSHSGYFDGQTSCIDTPVIKTNMFTEDYTLSFWVYPLDSGRAVYFGDHQISSIPTINFERTADGIFRYYHNGSPDKTFANTEAPKETWTMLTVTYTPGTMKVYKNGTLAETFSHTASITKNINGIMRIGRDRRTGSDSGATPLYGYISDFRFYVTCLSDGDVQELYKTKAYITDQGDIMCNKFIEDKAEAMVTENNTFECSEVYEEIDSAYERLEYIQTSGTQYIKTGIQSRDNITRLDAHYYQLTYNPGQILFGCYDGTTTMYFNYKESGTIEHRSHWMYTDLRTGAEWKENQDVKSTLIINGNNLTLTNNGKTITGVSSRSKGNNSYEMLLCAYSDRGSAGYAFYCKLYNFQIEVDNVLVRNFIPVKRKSDNVLGLFDSVNKVFYTNAGSGTFGAGPVVTNSNASIYEDGHISGREIIEI